MSKVKAVKENVVLSNAAGVVNAMRNYYPAAEYALLEQVANSTGFGAQRWCDALVVSLWPSRGIDIYGIEIKVRRSDVVKELRDPQKAEQIAQYCDFWYMVVGDESIVRVEEMPPNWGLLVPHKETMRQKIAATRLTRQPLTKEFLAAILRRAQEQDMNQLAKRKLYQDGYSAGADFERKRHKDNAPADEKMYTQLLRQVTEFQTASGISVQHNYHGPKLGEAVAFLLRRHESMDYSIDRKVIELEHAISGVRALRELLTKLEQEPSLLDAAKESTCKVDG